ncbi:MAG: hypothetical protein COA42_16540 [Alteromonadaceae bacterium]|nr:MAG: hypothetical protein COA42_16540 [Alteromonadaceae bacterium]
MKILDRFIVSITGTLCIGIASSIALADAEQLTPDPLVQSFGKEASVNDDAKIRVSVKGKLSASDKAQQYPDHLLGAYGKDRQQKANREKSKSGKARMLDIRNSFDYDLLTADPLLSSVY